MNHSEVFFKGMRKDKHKNHMIVGKHCKRSKIKNAMRKRHILQIEKNEHSPSNENN